MNARHKHPVPEQESLLARMEPRAKKKATPRQGSRRWGFVAALAVVVEHGRRTPPPAEKRTKRCPRCGKVGNIAKDFGTRVLDGERQPQSWCRDCRAARASGPQPVVVQESLAF